MDMQQHMNIIAADQLPNPSAIWLAPTDALPYSQPPSARLRYSSHRTRCISTRASATHSEPSASELSPGMVSARLSAAR